jgi:hypothetical protein
VKNAAKSRGVGNGPRSYTAEAEQQTLLAREKGEATREWRGDEVALGHATRDVLVVEAARAPSFLAPRLLHRTPGLAKSQSN